ncbi:MAG: hypothetical protein IT458_19750 [Planctomycetes bacterium]|nr:hypothetical protein [Planctomycetota bacterium]
MSSTDPVLERFARLPITVQRSIETALVGSGPIGAGSTLDHVHRARLASLVEASEKDLAARDPGMVPEIRANRPATLAQDRRSQGGAMPGHPRVSSAPTTATVCATPSARWFTSPKRSAPPSGCEADFLPGSIDAAFGVVADHLGLMVQAGADAARVGRVFATYMATLWSRPAIRATFESYEHLVALFDLRHGAGRAER